MKPKHELIRTRYRKQVERDIALKNEDFDTATRLSMEIARHSEQLRRMSMNPPGYTSKTEIEMANETVKDNETLDQLETRIRSLYSSLIRAELKAHHMREKRKAAEVCAVES